VLSQHRIDPDLADRPEIVLVERPLTAAQLARRARLLRTEPKVTMAAVVVGPVPNAKWWLLGDSSSAERRVVLEPAGLSLSPQWLEPSELAAVVDLVEITDKRRRSEFAANPRSVDRAVQGTKSTFRSGLPR
jgi:hypothetical protein